MIFIHIISIYFIPCGDIPTGRSAAVLDPKHQARGLLDEVEALDREVPISPMVI